ncbi:MAG: ATP-binding protein, partial [Nanoarchaeota archaeon]
MGDERSPLELELERMDRDENGSPRWTVPLSDLVMMQLVGDLNVMLNTLPDGDGADPLGRYGKIEEMIEQTREQATTHKLFTGIVDKTIQDQFGDRHVTLRELGQNGLDSYPPYEYRRIIRFNLETTDDHLVLRVRDYGIGMDIKTLVRDLLIPYNSGKEFDPDKIGE